LPSFAFPVDIGGAFPGAINVTMEWVPDPKVIAAELIKVANYLEDMQPPLRAAKAIGQADMHEHFAGNHGPNGEAWRELDEEYKVKKASMGGDPDDPLTLTGALENAAAGESAWMVDAHDVFFNTGALPDYGKMHEYGSGEGNVGMAAFGRASFRAIGREAGETGGPHASQGIGRGQALPRRPFIGLSAEAEIQIFEVFDLWFAAGTSIAIGPSGTIQARNAGKFGGRIYPDVGRLGV
jgi:phage gpG-like protein